MNTIFAGQKNFTPSYLLYPLSYCQNMFLSKNLSPKMPKNSLILLKNRKDCPALGDSSPNSPIHPAAGETLKPPKLP